MRVEQYLKIVGKGLHERVTFADLQAFEQLQDAEFAAADRKLEETIKATAAATSTPSPTAAIAGGAPAAAQPSAPGPTLAP